jgi:hypothetical protein
MSTPRRPNRPNLKLKQEGEMADARALAVLAGYKAPSKKMCRAIEHDLHEFSFLMVERATIGGGGDRGGHC